MLFFVLSVLIFLWGLIRTNLAWGSELICYNKPESLVIQKIAVCESNLNYEAVNFWDGGSHSYGVMQWKTASLAHFNAKYRLLPDIEEKEWLNIVMDPEIQIKMAKLVIRDGGIKNWYNCSKMLR